VGVRRLNKAFETILQRIQSSLPRTAVLVVTEHMRMASIPSKAGCFTRALSR
jgi:hypothetical protein